MNRISFIKRELPYEIEEEIKTLRTNIQFCGEDKKVIMFTSCISGEGKSTTALQVAMSLSELNKKVALIDCDLRKSILISQVEEGTVESGLSHFLAGQCKFADALYATNVPRLAVMFAGVVPPNPTELLSGERFKKMIESLREGFDYVIIDCAPIGMVVDAAIVAPVCDGTILIIESGIIKRKFAASSKAKLDRTGTPLLGIVLNKVDHKKDGKYYGKYYGKRYSKYYKKNED
ncbi:MAG: CpsD/CapB family tyrosine-protein kinase [Hespellia sp.]|nr:CpsD/CapB family tyrosine-protein kinase [Hespellia sp.]